MTVVFGKLSDVMVRQSSLRFHPLEHCSWLPMRTLKRVMKGGAKANLLFLTKIHPICVRTIYSIAYQQYWSD